MGESTWGEMSSAGRNVHGANYQWGEKSINPKDCITQIGTLQLQ